MQKHERVFIAALGLLILTLLTIPFVTAIAAQTAPVPQKPASPAEISASEQIQDLKQQVHDLQRSLAEKDVTLGTLLANFGQCRVQLIALTEPTKPAPPKADGPAPAAQPTKKTP